MKNHDPTFLNLIAIMFTLSLLCLLVFCFHINNKLDAINIELSDYSEYFYEIDGSIKFNEQMINELENTIKNSNGQ